MKNTFVLFCSLFIILFCSCSKKTDSTPGISYSYGISYLAEILLDKESTLYYTIPVINKNSTQEKVTITISGLPAGATATPSSITCTPPYIDSFFIAANDAAPGIYPITITVSSDSAADRIFIFKIIIPMPMAMWSVGDEKFAVEEMLLGNSLYPYTAHAINGGQLRIYFHQTPTVNGDYLISNKNEFLYGVTTSNAYISVSDTANDYTSTGLDGKMLHVDISEKLFTITFPPISVKNDINPNDSTTSSAVIQLQK